MIFIDFHSPSSLMNECSQVHRLKLIMHFHFNQCGRWLMECTFMSNNAYTDERVREWKSHTEI